MSIVGACNPAKVWEAKIRENYAALLEEQAPSSLDEVILGLETFFSKKSAELLAQCDVCNAWSSLDSDSDACPFCGINEEGQPVSGTSHIVNIEGGKIVTASPVTSVEVLDVNNETIQTAQGMDEEKEVVSPIEINAAAIEATGVALDEKPKGRRRKTPEEVTAAKALRKAPAVPKPSTPAISILAGGRAFSSEKELDEVIEEFRKGANDAGEALWRMGTAFRKMHDNLWLQRIDQENGKPKYKSWNQFVKEELDVSKDFAYKRMRVVENFSREQCSKYGLDLLKALLGAPKEDHEALLQKADAGASTSEIAEDVQKIRAEKNIAVLETLNTRTAKEEGRSLSVSSSIGSAAAAAVRRKPKEAPAVLVGLKSESFTLKALAANKARGAEDRDAKSLDDQPYVIVECTNGKKLVIGLKARPTGILEFKITVKTDD